MPFPRGQSIGAIRTLGSSSFVRTLSAIFLFAICLSSDIFFTHNFIFFYSYFTLLCIIVFLFLHKTEIICLPYAVIPLIAFTGIYFFSLFWSVRLKEAENIVLLFFTGLLTFFIFSNISLKQRDFFLFIRVMVIAASLNALLGIFQGTFGPKFPTLYGFAAHGTIYNPNAFSGFLGLVYPMAILIFLKERKDGWLLPLFLILLANIFSISRVGIFTLFLISVVALLFLFYKGDRSGGVKISFTILSSLLAYLFLIFLREKLFVDLSYETTLHPTPIPNAVVGRIEIWQGTWPIISNHFFWGAGLRSFEDMFKHFNNPFVVWPRPHAHNLFLHVTSEIGMVGMLFFIIFILNILLSGIKNYKQTEDIRLKIIPFFLLVTILGFFFNNLVEYNWEHSLFQVLFYFSASSMFAAKKFLLKGKEEIAFHLTKFRKISFLGVLTLFWVFYVGSPAIGNYYLHEAHKSIAKEDLRSLDYLKKTSFFDPSDPEPYLLLSQIYERAYRNTKNRVFLENAIHAQTKVTNLLPMNADFHLDLAKLYEDAKRMEEAQFYYKKAIDINPFMPQYKEELASFLGRIKKTEKAIILWEDLKTFLEKYEPRGTHLMKVYLCLGINYRKKGDLSLAKKNLGAVINFQDSIGEKETPDSFSRRDFISYKKIADDELKSSKK